DSIPSYTGSPYTVINNNVPLFTSEDLTRTDAFENYSDLDSLGRCRVAYANICKELIPTEERGAIGQIKPAGWHTEKYSGIDGNYLYNRCHLIAYCLAGENANVKNLTTGTRYFNVTGILPFETDVAEYMDNHPDNHVLYRVTPMYAGENLLCTGVLMEAQSVEDNGIKFCVFVYNVQPGIVIDYATGDSYEETPVTKSTEEVTMPAVESTESTGTTYIINTNSGKFHYPDCRGVKQMKEENKQEFTGIREALIEQGYDPCGMCNP
ncbi:MAG: DNA/RNA non-specific endonuclease, partial [Lachnospiraceae bacterium]|nr:DNA/RNA non-specific endonuclease [Lachnospiraceae bacterium]